VKIMPGWVRVLSKVNPLSYEADALRGLLIHTPSNLGPDFGVLAAAVAVGVTVPASLIDRLAR
jgi:ABC-2 type transport system permease protein